jgi:hypothetical protein
VCAGVEFDEAATEPTICRSDRKKVRPWWGIVGGELPRVALQAPPCMGSQKLWARTTLESTMYIQFN